MGNFPESCDIHAMKSSSLIPDVPDAAWTLVLPRTKLGPHRQHHFQLQNIDAPYTHIKVTIYPDGGIKRVRVLGRRVHNGDSPPDASQPQLAAATTVSGTEAAASPSAVTATTASKIQTVPALPLTAEAFAPFGKVVQAYADIHAVPSPRTTRITGANQGTATKFHKLALLESSYPAGSSATAGLSVYRCKPIQLVDGSGWDVKLLERHPATNQAFVPMGGGEGVEEPGKRYLVIVAPSGEDDKPALGGLRAFIATAGQAVVYNTGTWRE